MRAGLPIIATSVNGIPEEVIDKRTGLLVPPQNADALATAIKTLIDSPKLRREMGIAGRNKFLQDFTYERMLNKTEAVYQRLLDPKFDR